MARGVYGAVDWPVGCDPDWSDMNGACSDTAGNYIDGRTGESIDSLTLSNFLRGAELASRPGPEADAGPVPAPGRSPAPVGFDPLAWLKSGNNAVVAVLVFFGFVLLLSTMGGGRGRR